MTGAAKRIGRVIAIELSRRGFDVAIHYNTSQKEAEQVSLECNGAPIFQADLAKRGGNPAPFFYSARAVRSAGLPREQCRTIHAIQSFRHH